MSYNSSKRRVTSQRTPEKIPEGTVSRIWDGVLSFPGVFWNLLCWQINPLVRLYYVMISSLDGSRYKQRKLICWLEAMSGREVRNLQAVWEDGSIVCDVINAVMVGNCELKDHHGNSLRHAQELASQYFKLLPAFSNLELQKSFSPSLEKRLWRYLLSLRNALKMRMTNNIADQEEKDPEYLIAEEYVARGMGLILASRGERAIFFIYSRDDSSLADIHINIKGPNGDNGVATAGEPIDSENHSIKIDYRLTPDYLKVCYTPKSLGHHELSLTKYGFNIPGSPFIIKVGEHTGPPSEKFTYLEWLSEEQEEERRIEAERKKNLKVISRVIDFITDKMYLTDDGILIKVEESSRPPSPCNLKRGGRSLSPRPKCKLSAHKRSKSLTNQKLLQAAEFLRFSTSTEETKHVQDAASQVSEDFSMIQPVGVDQFQEKCQRIVKACDFLLSHGPKHQSLEILTTAEKILDIPFNSLSHHKSAFELNRAHVESDSEKDALGEVRSNPMESSQTDDETDDEKESRAIIDPSIAPEINVTRVDYSDRLYSMRKVDDIGFNAVMSFKNADLKNENISTSHLNEGEGGGRPFRPHKDARIARKSFKTVGYTKNRRSSSASFSINTSDELYDHQKDHFINCDEDKENQQVPSLKNDTVSDDLAQNSSEILEGNVLETVSVNSSKRSSRSTTPKKTKNSKQAKKVSNLVKKFENQVIHQNSSPEESELLEDNGSNTIIENTGEISSSKPDTKSFETNKNTMKPSKEGIKNNEQGIILLENTMESENKLLGGEVTNHDKEKINSVIKNEEVGSKLILEENVCSSSVILKGDINKKQTIILQDGGRNLVSRTIKDEIKVSLPNKSNIFESELNEINTNKKADELVDGDILNEAVEITSSIKSKISAFEDYMQNDKATDAQLEYKYREDEMINQSEGGATSKHDDKVENGKQLPGQAVLEKLENSELSDIQLLNEASSVRQGKIEGSQECIRNTEELFTFKPSGKVVGMDNNLEINLNENTEVDVKSSTDISAEPRNAIDDTKSGCVLLSIRHQSFDHKNHDDSMTERNKFYVDQNADYDTKSYNVSSKEFECTVKKDKHYENMNDVSSDTKLSTAEGSTMKSETEIESEMMIGYKIHQASIDESLTGEYEVTPLEDEIFSSSSYLECKEFDQSNNSIVESDLFHEVNNVVKKNEVDKNIDEHLILVLSTSPEIDCGIEKDETPNIGEISVDEHLNSFTGEDPALEKSVSLKNGVQKQSHEEHFYMAEQFSEASTIVNNETEDNTKIDTKESSICVSDKIVTDRSTETNESSGITDFPHETQAFMEGAFKTLKSNEVDIDVHSNCELEIEEENVTIKADVSIINSGERNINQSEVVSGGAVTEEAATFEMIKDYDCHHIEKINGTTYDQPLDVSKDDCRIESNHSLMKTETEIESNEIDKESTSPKFYLNEMNLPKSAISPEGDEKVVESLKSTHEEQVEIKGASGENEILIFENENRILTGDEIISNKSDSNINLDTKDSDSLSLGAELKTDTNETYVEVLTDSVIECTDKALDKEYETGSLDADSNEELLNIGSTPVVHIEQFQVHAESEVINGENHEENLCIKSDTVPKETNKSIFEADDKSFVKDNETVLENIENVVSDSQKEASEDIVSEVQNLEKSKEVNLNDNEVLEDNNTEKDVISTSTSNKDVNSSRQKIDQNEMDCLIKHETENNNETVLELMNEDSLKLEVETATEDCDRETNEAKILKEKEFESEKSINDSNVEIRKRVEISSCEIQTDFNHTVRSETKDETAPVAKQVMNESSFCSNEDFTLIEEEQSQVDVGGDPLGNETEITNVKIIEEMNEHALLYETVPHKSEEDMIETKLLKESESKSDDRVDSSITNDSNLEICNRKQRTIVDIRSDSDDNVRIAFNNEQQTLVEQKLIDKTVDRTVNKRSDKIDIEYTEADLSNEMKKSESSHEFVLSEEKSRGINEIDLEKMLNIGDDKQDICDEAHSVVNENEEYCTAATNDLDEQASLNEAQENLVENYATISIQSSNDLVIGKEALIKEDLLINTETSTFEATEAQNTLTSKFENQSPKIEDKSLDEKVVSTVSSLLTVPNAENEEALRIELVEVPEGDILCYKQVEDKTIFDSDNIETEKMGVVLQNESSVKICDGAVEICETNITNKLAEGIKDISVDMGSSIFELDQANFKIKEELNIKIDSTNIGDKEAQTENFLSTKGELIDDVKVDDEVSVIKETNIPGQLTEDMKDGDISTQNFKLDQGINNMDKSNIEIEECDNIGNKVVLAGNLLCRDVKMVDNEKYLIFKDEASTIEESNIHHQLAEDLRDISDDMSTKIVESDQVGSNKLEELNIEIDSDKTGTKEVPTENLLCTEDVKIDHEKSLEVNDEVLLIEEKNTPDQLAHIVLQNEAPVKVGDETVEIDEINIPDKLPEDIKYIPVDISSKILELDQVSDHKREEPNIEIDSDNIATKEVPVATENRLCTEDQLIDVEKSLNVNEEASVIEKTDVPELMSVDVSVDMSSKVIEFEQTDMNKMDDSNTKIDSTTVNDRENLIKELNITGACENESMLKIVASNIEKTSSDESTNDENGILIDISSKPLVLEHENVISCEYGLDNITNKSFLEISDHSHGIKSIAPEDSNTYSNLLENEIIPESKIDTLMNRTEDSKIHDTIEDYPNSTTVIKEPEDRNLCRLEINTNYEFNEISVSDEKNNPLESYSENKEPSTSDSASTDKQSTHNFKDIDQKVDSNTSEKDVSLSVELGYDNSDERNSIINVSKIDLSQTNKDSGVSEVTGMKLVEETYLSTQDENLEEAIDKDDVGICKTMVQSVTDSNELAADDTGTQLDDNQPENNQLSTEFSSSKEDQDNSLKTHTTLNKEDMDEEDSTGPVFCVILEPTRHENDADTSQIRIIEGSEVIGDATGEPCVLIRSSLMIETEENVNELFEAILIDNMTGINEKDQPSDNRWALDDSVIIEANSLLSVNDIINLEEETNDIIEVEQMSETITDVETKENEEADNEYGVVDQDIFKEGEVEPVSESKTDTKPIGVKKEIENLSTREKMVGDSEHSMNETNNAITEQLDELRSSFREIETMEEKSAQLRMLITDDSPISKESVENTKHGIEHEIENTKLTQPTTLESETEVKEHFLQIEENKNNCNKANEYLMNDTFEKEVDIRGIGKSEDTIDKEIDGINKYLMDDKFQKEIEIEKTEDKIYVKGIEDTPNELRFDHPSLQEYKVKDLNEFEEVKSIDIKSEIPIPEDDKVEKGGDNEISENGIYPQEPEPVEMTTKDFNVGEGESSKKATEVERSEDCEVGSNTEDEFNEENQPRTEETKRRNHLMEFEKNLFKVLNNSESRESESTITGEGIIEPSPVDRESKMDEKSIETEDLSPVEDTEDKNKSCNLQKDENERDFSENTDSEDAKILEQITDKVEVPQTETLLISNDFHQDKVFTSKSTDSSSSLKCLELDKMNYKLEMEQLQGSEDSELNKNKHSDEDETDLNLAKIEGVVGSENKIVLQDEKIILNIEIIPVTNFALTSIDPPELESESLEKSHTKVEEMAATLENEIPGEYNMSNKAESCSEEKLNAELNIIPKDISKIKVENIEELISDRTNLNLALKSDTLDDDENLVRNKYDAEENQLKSKSLEDIEEDKVHSSSEYNHESIVIDLVSSMDLDDSNFRSENFLSKELEGETDGIDNVSRDNNVKIACISSARENSEQLLNESFLDERNVSNDKLSVQYEATSTKHLESFIDEMKIDDSLCNNELVSGHIESSSDVQDDESLIEEVEKTIDGSAEIQINTPSKEDLRDSELVMFAENSKTDAAQIDHRDAEQAGVKKIVESKKFTEEPDSGNDELVENLSKIESNEGLYEGELVPLHFEENVSNKTGIKPDLLEDEFIMDKEIVISKNDTDNTEEKVLLEEQNENMLIEMEEELLVKCDIVYEQEVKEKTESSNEVQFKSASKVEGLEELSFAENDKSNDSSSLSTSIVCETYSSKLESSEESSALKKVNVDNNGKRHIVPDETEEDGMITSVEMEEYKSSRVEDLAPNSEMISSVADEEKIESEDVDNRSASNDIELFQQQIESEPCDGVLNVLSDKNKQDRNIDQAETNINRLDNEKLEETTENMQVEININRLQNEKVGETTENLPLSTFELSQLSLGRQEQFLLVNLSQDGCHVNEDSTPIRGSENKSIGVKGLIAKFSNEATELNKSEGIQNSEFGAKSDLKSLIITEDRKFVKDLICDEVGNKENNKPGQINKLSELIHHFEKGKVEGEKYIKSINDYSDNKIKVISQINENVDEKDIFFVNENPEVIDASYSMTDKDEKFPLEHEFDLCPLGSNNDEVTAKSYTDISSGIDDSLTTNENFGSSEHLLLCVEGIEYYEDGDELATDSKEQTADDNTINEIIKNEKDDSCYDKLPLSIEISEETRNNITSTENRVGSDNNRIPIDINTTNENFESHTQHDHLITQDLNTENNLVRSIKGNLNDIGTVNLLQQTNPENANELNILKGDKESLIFTEKEVLIEVGQSEFSINFENKNQEESVVIDNQKICELPDDVISTEVLDESQNEKQSQENLLQGSPEFNSLFQTSEEPHIVESRSIMSNASADTQNFDSRNLCYEIFNEISNEKCKAEEETLFKSSISDKQGTDSTGSELNRSLSLIVNSSLESDFNLNSNLQDDQNISECVFEVLMSNSERLESVEEPERDSFEDIYSSEAGEACAEFNELPINEELTNKEFFDEEKTNHVEGVDGTQEFHLWPSTNVESLSKLTLTSELSEDIDFDSIISAPSLDEALKKFEKRLNDKMNKENSSYEDILLHPNEMERSEEAIVETTNNTVEPRLGEQKLKETINSQEESKENSIDNLLSSYEGSIPCIIETTDDYEECTHPLSNQDHTSTRVDEPMNIEHPSIFEEVNTNQCDSSIIIENEPHSILNLEIGSSGADEQNIEHPSIIRMNQCQDTRVIIENVLDVTKPNIDDKISSASSLSLYQFPPRPSSRMEMIREDLEEDNDNPENEEIGHVKETRLSPQVDSDDVSVSDISDCLEKFDSLLQENELHDMDLQKNDLYSVIYPEEIGGEELTRINVTDYETGELPGNIAEESGELLDNITEESGMPDCDPTICELTTRDVLEAESLHLNKSLKTHEVSKDTDSNYDHHLEVAETHDLDSSNENLNSNFKNQQSSLDSFLNAATENQRIDSEEPSYQSEKEVVSISSQENCSQKPKPESEKSLVLSKKLYWDQKLKSLQIEQENKSKRFVEKKIKTVTKYHGNKVVSEESTLKTIKREDQLLGQESPTDKDSSKEPLSRRVFSNQVLEIKEPIEIVVDNSDKSDLEIVEGIKSVDKWKNYWNNLAVDRDDQNEILRRQPSIRVQGIVASSRTIFEKSNNLERSTSYELLTDKNNLKNKNHISAKSIGENLNEIGLKTSEINPKWRKDNNNTPNLNTECGAGFNNLYKSKSISNISERIQLFEQKTVDLKQGLKTERKSQINNIDLLLACGNVKNCSTDSISRPCSPTTIRIDYFDENQGVIPNNQSINKKVNSESMDSSDGDMYNPLTMTFSGRTRSFSTGKIEEAPDSPLSNIEGDRSSAVVITKLEEDLEKTESLCGEFERKSQFDPTSISRAKSEGNLNINEKATSRARFEQAKLFFKSLEKERVNTKNTIFDCSLTEFKKTRSKQLSMDSDSCGESCKPKKKESKYRRRGRRRRKDSTMKVRSAPTSDSECKIFMYDSEFGGSERHKNKRVSERFHVKNLFRDISGDSDGIFKGIPNRKAVLASLEDLRTDSFPEQRTFDSDEPVRSYSMSNIPSGYQDEYPYLPTTPPNQYRPRSQFEDRLISRCRLVTYEMNI